MLRTAAFHPVEKEIQRCAVIGGVKGEGSVRCSSCIVYDQRRAAQSDAIDLPGKSLLRLGISVVHRETNA